MDSSGAEAQLGPEVGGDVYGQSMGIGDGADFGYDVELFAR